MEALHQGYGVALPHSDRLRMARHLLRVWALDRKPLASVGSEPPVQTLPVQRYGAAPVL